MPQARDTSIHFLDVIQILERQGITVKICDISDYLNIRPGVTRTVKEMEKGYLRKRMQREDGRITYISLTEEGRKLSEKYNENYFFRSGTVSGEHFRSRCGSYDTRHRDFYQVMCEGERSLKNKENDMMDLHKEAF